ARDAEQRSRADDGPRVPVVAVVIIFFFLWQVEPARPGFEQDVARVLFFALPEGFPEFGFVALRLYAPVEAFETRRISHQRLDVVFQRHGRLAVDFRLLAGRRDLFPTARPLTFPA